MASSTWTWALNQISRILPLDEQSLREILDYSSSLSPEAAATHLKDILGDSPAALEFISSFNARRAPPPPPPAPAPNRPITEQSHSAPGKKKKGKGRNASLNNLPPPRRPDDYGNTEGAYRKTNEGDYMPGDPRANNNNGRPSNAFSLSGPTPPPRQSSSASASTAPSISILGPSLPNVRTGRTASPANRSHASPSKAPASSSSSTNHSPAPSKKKVTVPSGTPMRGATQDLSDLESALRSLEMSTNPTLSAAAVPADQRRCSCMGLKHPLLAAAPNCLSCGKIVCAKEGLAPCTFCGAALLTPTQVQDMVRALREERGRERMAVNNNSNSLHHAAYKGPGVGLGFDLAANDALAKATAHRDRLLGFQAHNAQRTRVVDEAAAFETPETGVTQWGSAEQRAAQLKRQQKVLREMEWASRPEYEKRRVVVSVDLVGGKVVKRMGAVERPAAELEMEEEDNQGDGEAVTSSSREDKAGGGGGAFSHNPLLGKLTRPKWRPPPPTTADASNENNIANGKGKGKDKAAETTTITNNNTDRPAETKGRGRGQWRRVQDDNDSGEVVGEAYILNGGVYGYEATTTTEGEKGDEPACG